VGSGCDFKAMNQDDAYAEELYIALPLIGRVEVGGAKGVKEMREKPNTKKVPTDEAYYVGAAELADKFIVLMQQGRDPLFLSTSTWDLVQTSLDHEMN
jgi:hypothetical protein